MDLRVRPNTVQNQTVEKLREAILAGVFKPGERLVEAQLCNMLGVSRPSVREALRSLAAERLIAFVPNRGTQIPLISWPEARDIYHVRALLEGEAAALYATQAQPEDLAAMREALSGFAAAVGTHDKAGLLKETARFYQVILENCGNAVVADLLGGLLARITFLRDRSMSRPGRATHSLSEMLAICEAIEKADPEEARRAAIRHVEMARDAARASYRDDGELS
jgi:DNA-binding GntR family transcriptional regulator